MLQSMVIIRGQCVARMWDFVDELRQVAAVNERRSVAVDVVDWIGLDHAQIDVFLDDADVGRLPLDDDVLGRGERRLWLRAPLENDLTFLLFVGEPALDDNGLRFARQ